MKDAASDYSGPKSGLIRVLRWLSFLLPGDFLKTFFYLNFIDRPRSALREALFAFYRYDHVYAVLKEFKNKCIEPFSVLEFGTADGYSFVKLLYATRYLHLTKQVTVHTFDTFEGMPRAVDEKDREWTAGDDWVEGQFRGRYETLHAYCAKRFDNFKIHRGRFEATMDDGFLRSLRECPPALIWIDCDYYSSARTVFERIIDLIPNGCVIYFDDLDNLNYGSRTTGESRLVYEVNHGVFGENTELIMDARLSLFSRRIYRFFRLPPNRLYRQAHEMNAREHVRWHAGGSPMP